MNGICFIWSRGRLISTSPPAGDDWYLNLSSQMRPTGRDLGGNRSERRSGTTSRVTVVLVFCLRMHRLSLTLVLTIFERNEMNCLGSSEYMTVFTSFTHASFLNLRADQLVDQNFVPKIDHFVTSLPYYSLYKMSKNGNTSPLFKKFLNKHLDLFKPFFLHCSNQR